MKFPLFSKCVIFLYENNEPNPSASCFFFHKLVYTCMQRNVETF